MAQAAEAQAVPVMGAATEPGADALRLSTGRMWGILALLTAGVLIAYIDRTSIASAIADKPFIAHFNMSDVDRGWVSAAFFWSYAALQIPIGWVVDRYGVKMPYAICFGLWCIATAATGLMTVVAGLVIMRLIVGATEAVVIPASYRWIRNNMPEKHAGAATGILAAGNKVGTAVGAPIAAWLIVWHSWEMMFVLTGLLGMLWLIPWFLAVDNDLPNKEQMVAARKRASSVTFGAIIKSPVVWGGMICNFCYGYFTFYCMTWMPAYLVEQHGLSLESSGLYTFFSFAGIAIVAIAAGWAADRIIARGSDAVLTRKIFIVAGYVGATSVLFGAWTDNLGWALFWNVFSLSCLGLTTANQLALAKVTLVPKQATGLVVGVQQVAASLSGGVAASLSGWLLHVSGSYDLPMMVIVVFLVLGAASAIILLRPKWSPRVSETTID